MCACVFISEYFVLYLPKIKVDEFLDLTWMDLIFKSSTGGLVDHVILDQGCSYQERSCTRGALCWQNFLYPDLFLSWPPFHIGRVSVSDTLPVLHIRECLAISEKSREVLIREKPCSFGLCAGCRRFPLGCQHRWFSNIFLFSSEEIPALSWPSLASSLNPSGIGGALCLGDFLQSDAQLFNLKIRNSSKFVICAWDSTLSSQAMLKICH